MTEQELTALAKMHILVAEISRCVEDDNRKVVYRKLDALDVLIREAAAERDALKAQVDEAYEKGVNDVFSRVDDITHGNYDAATFRLRFRLRAEEGAHR